jgi:hypothetical protein
VTHYEIQVWTWDFRSHPFDPHYGQLIDEWQSYRGSHPAHATVRHGVHEWARDDDGDGRREVHCNSCEGAGAALRTYMRAFRGVHKQYLHLYVATYEAMVNAKRMTPELIRRMCLGNRSEHTGYT